MELSNDQKAILRLLAQRGAAGYEDLSALLGISADEVHAKAQAAAAQLEADGIPAPSIPAPGTAEPESPAAPMTRTEPPAPSEPDEPAKPVAPAPVTPPVQPEPPAPTAPKPVAPSPPPPAAKPKPSQPPKLSLPKSGGARAALAAGVAVVVALIVILALGGGDSGDPSSTTAAGESTSGAEETVSASTNPKLTQAVLDPVAGGDAKGVATFGRVKNSLALQLEAEGLEPTANGQSYTVWLYQSPQKMLPLASTAVAENGKIGAQVQVPTEVLAYLANETFDQLDISLTDDATLKASLAKATKEKTTPIYTGTDVLRGTITGPIIGAAKKEAKAGN